MMDAVRADSILLADAISSIQSFISVFTGVYVLLIFAYILTSWIRLPYSPTLNRIQRFLYDVCEPYLRVFRRFLPPLGPLDLSPIVAVFSLILVSSLAAGDGSKTRARLDSWLLVWRCAFPRARERTPSWAGTATAGRCVLPLRLSAAGRTRPSSRSSRPRSAFQRIPFRWSPATAVATSSSS
jgi:YggT family protein